VVETLSVGVEVSWGQVPGAGLGGAPARDSR
jgi:hypothetical protein